MGTLISGYTYLLFEGMYVYQDKIYKNSKKGKWKDFTSNHALIAHTETSHSYTYKFQKSLIRMRPHIGCTLLDRSI